MGHLNSPFPNPPRGRGEQAKAHANAYPFAVGDRSHAQPSGEHGEDPPFAWAARAAVRRLLFFVLFCLDNPNHSPPLVHIRCLEFFDSSLVQQLGDDVMRTLARDFIGGDDCRHAAESVKTHLGAHERGNHQNILQG